MNPEDFKELVDSLHEDWETMGLHKFIATYCPWKEGFHAENIEGLIDGACAVRRQTHDGQELLTIWMQDEHHLAGRWDEYCVQLKDIPCEFKRIYGHDISLPIMKTRVTRIKEVRWISTWLVFESQLLSDW